VIGIVAIALLAGGGAFFFIAHETGYEMLEDQTHEKAHGITEVGKDMLSFIMLDGSSGRLRGALEALNSSHQVKDVLILRNDGSIYMRLDTQSVGAALPIENFAELPAFPGEKFLAIPEKGVLYEYIISPLSNPPQCHSCHDAGDSRRGYLAVKISMSDVVATSSRHRTTNILMVVGVFLGVGIAIVFALLLFVIRPVGRLRDQMRNVSNEIDTVGRGEQIRFSELPPVERKDEIGELVATYNKLIGRLNQANAQLHDMHQGQLEQADRLATTGEMAASIAHEIRNPIAGVLGALQVMLDELGADDPRREILEEMKTQVERVNHAVTDLLAYARPLPPMFEETSLNDIITRTSTMLSRQMRDKNLDVIHVLEPRPVMIVGDRKQLQQVLWNIILNGMQAMDERGVMTISLTEQSGTAIIAVTDTGSGISAEDIENIFKPFFTTKHKGTGLGMTISRRIVEQHHGSMTITSRPGEGTTVTIQLPLKQHS
jgi:signal transduction histidine kinase